MFVAIVMRHLEATGNRPGAVTGDTRRQAIERACKLRSEWNNGTYRIFVGELTTEVVEPVRYEEVPIEL